MQDCHGIQRTPSGLLLQNSILRKRLSNSTLSKTRNDIDDSLSSVTSPSSFRRSGRSCLAMQDSHGIKTTPSSFLLRDNILRRNSPVDTFTLNANKPRNTRNINVLPNGETLKQRRSPLTLSGSVSCQEALEGILEDSTRSGSSHRRVSCLNTSSHHMTTRTPLPRLSGEDEADPTQKEKRGEAHLQKQGRHSSMTNFLTYVTQMEPTDFQEDNPYGTAANYCQDLLCPSVGGTNMEVQGGEMKEPMKSSRSSIFNRTVCAFMLFSAAVAFQGYFHTNLTSDKLFAINHDISDTNESLTRMKNSIARSEDLAARLKEEVADLYETQEDLLPIGAADAIYRYHRTYLRGAASTKLELKNEHFKERMEHFEKGKYDMADQVANLKEHIQKESYRDVLEK